MKKSTIWILGIVMGLSFLSLLYLQVSYIEEMMKTRKEQFDSAVRNSLDRVSKGCGICRDQTLVDRRYFRSGKKSTDCE